MKTRALSIFVLLIGMGCSSPQDKKEETTPTETTTKADEPECFQGCVLNSQGQCQLTASSMDWSSVEEEVVQCDARCCQGAPTASGSSDTDGDGIYGDADQCPEDAEDYDGFQDDDGCSDPDNDGDGIPDETDVCPLDPEDLDGTDDQDGCPD